MQAILTKYIPSLKADGSCPACRITGGWQCDFHQARGVEKSRALGVMLREISASLHADELSWICARHELESDEFMTREQKASQMLGI
jgi:hypothetical protein